jgi:hypothetical protein
MAAAWPSGVPQRLLRASYSRTPPDDVLRTQMDAGPAFQRKRSGSIGDVRQGNLKLTKSELILFQSFWENTLVSGTRDFTGWIDPVTAVGHTARFIGGQMPKEKPAPKGPFWLVEIQIEVLS